MTPMWAADQWFQTAIYYEDPDKNIIELNVDNFTNLWAVTEGLKELPSQLHVFIDPEKLIAARKAGASPWDVHVRAFAGEFVPAKPYDWAEATEPLPKVATRGSAPVVPPTASAGID